MAAGSVATAVGAARRRVGHTVSVVVEVDRIEAAVVDVVPLGWITHSAPRLDVALDL